MPDFLAPARVGGVYLVSALVVLVNGVFATLACRVVAQMRRETRPSGGRWMRSLETAVPLAVVLLVSWAARPAPDDAPAEFMRVALIQRNAPCVFRAGRERQDPVEAYRRLVEVAAPAKPDLVVWGESGMSEFGYLVGERAQSAAKYFSHLAGGASLLTGGDYRETMNGAVRVYNGAGLYTPAGDGMDFQVYAKQHLVPFGVYIPFDKWITPLQKL